MNAWLSYDIVRFKIELGVEVQFKCKNAPKQCVNSYGEAVILLRLRVHQHTDTYGNTPIRPHGDNMLVGFKVELANREREREREIYSHNAGNQKGFCVQDFG